MATARDGSGAPDGTHVGAPRERRDPKRLVLALMASVTVLNVMDRQLLAVLIEPIKQELGVSDTAMGLLSGTSFALLHVAASVPIAVWADRGTRRSIIALGLALWSGLTVLTGFARTFAEMFVIRVGVGIGEATGGGPAQSLLSDSFPPERRATALSILVMGGPIGSMVAFAGGGWLGETFGWRVAFVVFGVPGLLLALLIRMAVPEPERGAFDTGETDDVGASRSEALEPVPPVEATRFLLGVASIRNLVLSSGLNTVGIYALLVWSVPYLSRVHGLDASEAGLRLALSSSLFTALGTFFGGPVADRLYARDPRWLAWMPATTSFLVMPLGLGFVLAPTATIATLFLAPASFMSGVQFGPVYSGVQTLAAPQMRALAAALITTINTILGLGVAPPLVGFLNDLWASAYGGAAIRYSLALVLTSHLGASFLLWRAARTLTSDLAARDRYLARAA